jgi:hypothetical protein
MQLDKRGLEITLDDVASTIQQFLPAVHGVHGAAQLLQLFEDVGGGQLPSPGGSRARPQGLTDTAHHVIEFDLP